MNGNTQPNPIFKPYKLFENNKSSRKKKVKSEHVNCI